MKKRTNRKTQKRQRGGAGYTPLQYVNPNYQMPAAWGPGENKSLPVPDLIARPALAANFAGGGRKRKGTRRQLRSPRKRSPAESHASLKGGFFMPSIMSPVVSNFGVVAPAIALAGYRYMNRARGLSKKALGLFPRVGRHVTRRLRKH